MKSFFKAGQKAGYPWFHLYLADSLADRFPESLQKQSRWFLLHLAMQSGAGHIRSDLNSLKTEMEEWCPDAEIREQTEKILPELIRAGTDCGLIGQLENEQSPADTLAVPRPPLVLTGDGRHIYFLRRRREEDRLIASLIRRVRSDTAAAVRPAADPADALINTLKGGARLVLLAGGPGTGKTTTVAKLTGALEPDGWRILLAAPTGRAAARMSESLSGRFAGRTIHSLLYTGQSEIQKADLLIIDEASMADLSLMNQLLAVLPERTSLLLVGDPDQLPSVESGTLLGDLLGDGHSRLPVVRLEKIYRSDTAITDAAAAVRLGDIDSLAGSMNGPVCLKNPDSPQKMAARIAAQYRSVLSENHDKKSLFRVCSELAVLTPLRKGPWGVESMNSEISRLTGGFPCEGMPVVITKNDPERQLWNGDRGVIRREDGHWRALFERPGGIRSFPTAALPGWEAAWVQTIHKSQGSEYNRVMVLLPDGAERLLTREILYTALTRARTSAVLYAHENALKTTLSRRVVRNSRIRSWAAADGERPK